MYISWLGLKMKQKNKDDLYNLEIVYNPPCYKCGCKNENILIPFCGKCFKKLIKKKKKI